ncbi:MAG: hypothetical protein ACQETH_02760 [Candidatus Rifleibacteriota bacterium]
MKTVKLITLFLMVTFAQCLLFADAEVRTKTPAEKNFYQKVIQACNKAVSTINTNWHQKRSPRKKQSKHISVGSEKSLLTYFFRVSWQDKEKIIAAGKKAQEKMAGSMTNMSQAVDSNRTKALEELAKKMGAAAEAKDFTEIARLQKEAEKLSEKIENEIAPSKQKLENIIKEHAPRDARLKVKIAVNRLLQRFAKQPQTGKLENGMRFYRVENGRMVNEKWLEGSTYVFLGDNWQFKENEQSKEMIFFKDSNQIHTIVKSMIVEVAAEKQRALNTLNQMDLKALQKLVNHTF